MATSLERAAPPITEAQFQRTVLELARVYGWKVFCDRVAWRSDPGWLDICAVHPVWRRTVFAEIKTAKGRVSVAQDGWIACHLAAGNEAYIWRPAYWDEIVRVFSQPERPGETTLGRN